MSPAVTAALVSASIIGGVGLITAVVNRMGGARNLAREAHRELLGKHLAPLGKHVPGVVAVSHTYIERAKKGQSIDGWRSKAMDHGNGLKSLRSDVRYILYGADNALRELSRVGSWVQHFTSADPVAAERFLTAADDLRKQLDDTVAKSYRRGEPPSWLDRRRLDRAAQALRAVWDERMGTGAGPAVT